MSELETDLGILSHRQTWGTDERAFGKTWKVERAAEDQGREREDPSLRNGQKKKSLQQNVTITEEADGRPW